MAYISPGRGNCEAMRASNIVLYCGFTAGHTAATALIDIATGAFNPNRARRVSCVSFSGVCSSWVVRDNRFRLKADGDGCNCMSLM